MSEERQRRYARYMAACRAVSAVKGELRVAQVEFLLCVAVNPGSTSRELSDLLDCSESASSRNIDIFSDVENEKNKNKMLGYVTEYSDRKDRRKRLVRLTRKGENFLETIDRLAFPNQ